MSEIMKIVLVQITLFNEPRVIMPLALNLNVKNSRYVTSMELC